MSLLNLTPPTVGQPNATEDVDTVNAFNTIQTWANGNIDESNLTNSTLQRLGLNGSGTTGRGGIETATTEATSSTSYTLLATPDRVQGIVLPTKGIIEILYHAYWNETVDTAARAAIFIGSNQLKVGQYGVAAPAVQEAVNPGAANITEPLSSCWYGLTSGGAGSQATGQSAPVTTGQVIAAHQPTSVDQAGVVAGGACRVFAAAGTYDVSVQFKVSSGTVNVLNRRLYVAAVTYP